MLGERVGKTGKSNGWVESCRGSSSERGVLFDSLANSSACSVKPRRNVLQCIDPETPYLSRIFLVETGYYILYNGQVNLNKRQA